MREANRGAMNTMANPNQNATVSACYITNRDASPVERRLKEIEEKSRGEKSRGIVWNDSELIPENCQKATLSILKEAKQHLNAAVFRLLELEKNIGATCGSDGESCKQMEPNSFYEIWTDLPSFIRLKTLIVTSTVDRIRNSIIHADSKVGTHSKAIEKHPMECEKNTMEPNHIERLYCEVIALDDAVRHLDLLVTELCEGENYYPVTAEKENCQAVKCPTFTTVWRGLSETLAVSAARIDTAVSQISSTVFFEG